MACPERSAHLRRKSHYASGRLMANSTCCAPIPISAVQDAMANHAPAPQPVPVLLFQLQPWKLAMGALAGPCDAPFRQSRCAKHQALRQSVKLTSPCPKATSASQVFLQSRIRCFSHCNPLQSTVRQNIQIDFVICQPVISPRSNELNRLFYPTPYPDIL